MNESHSALLHQYRFAEDCYWEGYPETGWFRMAEGLLTRRLLRIGMTETQVAAAIEYIRLESQHIVDPAWQEDIALARFIGQSFAQFHDGEVVYFLFRDRMPQAVEVEEINAYLRKHCPSRALLKLDESSRLMWR